MTLPETIFEVHDISGFPVVRTRPDAARPGYAAQWEIEMDALVARGVPFVIVFDGPRPEETHEDRKRRGLWLKHNRQRLGALCRALISVEPDPMQRTALDARSAMAEKAFGIPSRVVASATEAGDAARAALSVP
ncbi:MAG: hypothetical protein F8N37_17685 [Telmatospirillum sp.]|nr:hypothetical protein [Telmatospirillum sp.]